MAKDSSLRFAAVGMTSHPHVPYLRRRKCRSKFKDFDRRRHSCHTNQCHSAAKQGILKKKAALTFKTAPYSGLLLVYRLRRKESPSIQINSSKNTYSIVNSSLLHHLPYHLAQLRADFYEIHTGGKMRNVY